MKPENVIKQLRLIAEGKRTFDNQEMAGLLHRVASHIKMLERDNGRLRGKIRRKRIEG